MQVQLLVGELRSHMPCGQNKTKHKTEATFIVINSIKTFRKMIHIKEKKILIKEKWEIIALVAISKVSGAKGMKKGLVHLTEGARKC